MTKAIYRYRLVELFVLMLCFLASSEAATLVVNQSSGPYTSLTAALAAAGDNDVIQITDSGLYDENLPKPINPSINTLTITNANGTAPVIQRSAEGGPVIRYQPASGNGTLTLKGANPGSKITVRQAEAGNPDACIDLGTNPADTHNCILENVILDKDITSGGALMEFYNGGNHTLTRVDFSGRDPLNADLDGYVRATPQPGGSIVFTDCNMTADGAGIIYVPTKTVGEPNVLPYGPVTFNNCIFAPGPDSLSPGIAVIRGMGELTAPPPGTAITFNNCSFESGTARMFSSNADGVIFTFNNPKFTGSCGDIAFHIYGGASVGPTVTISGSAGNPVDFEIPSTVLPVRMLCGTLNLNYCTYARNAATVVDCAFEGPLTSPVSVTIQNSTFTNGSGMVNIISVNGDGSAAPHSFTGTVNIENSSWTGQTAQGAFIWFADPSRTVPSTLTVKNSVLSGRTGSANLFAVHSMDTVMMEGCTLDGDAAAPGDGNVLMVTHKGTYKDCIIRNINASLTTSDASDVTFDGCTMNHIGDILFRLYTGGTLTFRNMTLDDTSFIADFGRITEGYVNFDHCNLLAFGFDPDAEISNPNPALRQPLEGVGANISMNRCFKDFNYGSAFHLCMPNPDAYNGGDVVFSATNCIFKSNPTYGWLIEVNSGGHDPMPSVINLTHCTFYGPTANIYVSTEDEQVSPVKDIVNSRFNIYDMHEGGAAVNGTSTDGESRYDLYFGGIAGDGSWLGLPKIGAIFADPLLDPTGHLTVGSPARAAAVGSIVPVDFDGDPRPNPPVTLPDIGADEAGPTAIEMWMMY